MHSRRINPNPNYREVFKEISSINRNLNAKDYKGAVLDIVDQNIFTELLDITITSKEDLSGVTQEELLKSLFK